MIYDCKQFQNNIDKYKPKKSEKTLKEMPLEERELELEEKYRNGELLR